MKQPGFFDVEERLARLSGLGDQLEAFSRTVDFEVFRPDLDGITTRKCILRTLGVNTCRTGHIEVHATSRDAGTRSGRNAPASGCSSTFQR